jgi:hypothetical protein
MHNTPKSAYVSYVWLHPVETLIRCYAIVRPRRHPVAQVHEGRHHLCPEARQEIPVMQHRACAIRGHADKVIQ